MSKHDYKGDCDYGDDGRDIVISQLNEIPEFKKHGIYFVKREDGTQDISCRKHGDSREFNGSIRWFEDNDTFYKATQKMSLPEVRAKLSTMFLLYVNNPLKNKEKPLEFTKFDFKPWSFFLELELEGNVKMVRSENINNLCRIDFYRNNGKPVTSKTYFTEYPLEGESSLIDFKFSLPTYFINLFK